MEKILALYEYVDGVNDTPFPNSDEQVFIGSFTYNAVRMGGAPSITATVKHSLCLDNLWSRDVYAEFDGEKDSQTIADVVGSSLRAVQLLIKDLAEKDLIDVQKRGHAIIPYKNYSKIAIYYAHQDILNNGGKSK